MKSEITDRQRYLIDCLNRTATGSCLTRSVTEGFNAKYGTEQVTEALADMRILTGICAPRPYLKETLARWLTSQSKTAKPFTR